jgi:hypothetical protein
MSAKEMSRMNQTRAKAIAAYFALADAVLETVRMSATNAEYGKEYDRLVTNDEHYQAAARIAASCLRRAILRERQEP